MAEINTITKGKAKTDVPTLLELTILPLVFAASAILFRLFVYIEAFTSYIGVNTTNIA